MSGRRARFEERLEDAEEHVERHAGAVQRRRDPSGLAAVLELALLEIADELVRARSACSSWWRATDRRRRRCRTGKRVDRA